MNTTKTLLTNAWAAWPKALLLAFAMLATQASASQEKLAASIQATRDEVIATRDQLQATVNSIDALVKQKEGDMKPTYNAYVADVTKAQADAAKTVKRSTAMEADAKAHFATWQQDIEGIANEKLRKQAQKRLAAVQKSYDKATAELQAAGTSFNPYLSDLADIKKMLANDLTPGGVKAIKGTVSSAKFNLGVVRTHLFDAIKELDSMQQSLTTTAKK